MAAYSEGDLLRQRRAKGLSVILVSSFVFVGLSQVRLQAVTAGGILNKAKKTNHFVITKTEPARRGTILAADGPALAEDLPLSRLTLTYKSLPKVPGFFADLAVATGVPEAQLEAGAIDGKGVEWELPLSSEQAQAVLNVRTRWNAGGLGLERTFGRRYPLGSMAAGIVGCLRPDSKPDGLEGLFNSQLTGTDGVKVGLTDRSGSFLPTHISAESKDSRDGITVETTLDSGLQIAASQAVREAVEIHKANCGTAVILDPKTGDILAVANWPTFDPQPVPGASPLPRSSDLDMAYMARMEPGSMMKILTLAKLIDQSGMPKSVDCQGQIEVSGHVIRCDDHSGNRAHGMIPASGAIAQSCNVSAATWGMAIGVRPFYDYLVKLGLLDKPGIGLRGEIPGSALENPPAPRLETADWGFGQSLTATPLAFADALSCLANGGVRMKLRLIRRVGDKSYPAVSEGQMVTAKSAETVLRYMEGVFDQEHGTGHGLRIPGYRLAGKTGTAQIANKSGHYVANFVGFIPAEKPVAEVLVMIQNPTVGGYYGAGVAGQAFVTLAHAVIRRFNLPATEPIVEKKVTVPIAKRKAR